MDNSLEKFKRKNQEWYKSMSDKKSVEGICPFAHSTRCPHYFQSMRRLKLLSFPKKAKLRDELSIIETRWKQVGLWYNCLEIEPNAFWKYYLVLDFCPEASTKHPDPRVKGIYASTIEEYVPQICTLEETGEDIVVEPSIEEIRRRLKESNTPDDDWRWHFKNVKEVHFTECRYYAIQKANPAFITLNISKDEIYPRKEEAVQPATENTEEKGSEKTFIPGEEYRSIKYRGESFHFTRRQAIALQMLHAASLRGNPDVFEGTIVEHINAVMGVLTKEKRLSNVFKKWQKDKRIWEGLIIKSGHRFYRLDC